MIDPDDAYHLLQTDVDTGLRCPSCWSTFVRKVAKPSLPPFACSGCGNRWRAWQPTKAAA